MKKILPGLVVVCALALCSCATDGGYNTQKGAAIGAVGGALAGQAIGRNTAGTLIGAASGALVGAVAGNAVDQSNQQKKLAQQQVPPPAYAPPPPPPPQEGPPGRWVEVPGRWVNGQWVPPHRAWVPVNPGPEGPPPPPPPAYALPAPPDVVPIPGTYAYFVPGIEANIFFYHGIWYRHWGRHWYTARFYNGPWAFVPGPRVPAVLVTLPPGWRRVPPEYRPIPHRELERNWRRWERERRWEH